MPLPVVVEELWLYRDIRSTGLFCEDELFVDLIKQRERALRKAGGILSLIWSLTEMNMIVAAVVFVVAIKIAEAAAVVVTAVIVTLVVVIKEVNGGW